MAKWAFDAPRHTTSDAQFWRAKIAGLNERYLRGLHQSAPEAVERSVALGTVLPAAPGYFPAVAATVSTPPPTSETAVSAAAALYPLLAPAQLRSHPIKGRKAQDLQRILTSSRSEDYVTWNVVQLLSVLDPCRWWKHLLCLARTENPEFALAYDEEDLPTINTWSSFAAPAEYERRSRARMAQSPDAATAARSRIADPVEGCSEVDIVFSGRRYLVFVEAKLGSDISMRTRHDPERNQIARNIDVLLEVAGAREPVFLMMAADRGPARGFVQLMTAYRQSSDLLAVQLPHREPETLARVSEGLTILLWSDLIAVATTQLEQVVAELSRRVGAP